jgi:hypothetical protein
MVTKGVDGVSERSALAVAANVLYHGIAVHQVEVVSRDVRRWGAGIAYDEMNRETSFRLALGVGDAAVPVGGVQDDDLCR